MQTPLVQTPVARAKAGGVEDPAAGRVYDSPAFMHHDFSLTHVYFLQQPPFFSNFSYATRSLLSTHVCPVGLYTSSYHPANTRVA